MKRLLLFTALLCALAGPLAAQVPVSMAPVTKFQFLSNAGIPFAAGCLFTYQAGTTNPAATYVDSTGTAQNTNPIILDGGGRADIWIPNAAFKFQLKSAGGVNCASGSTIWTVDNITGVLGLLNLANTWTASNTFTQPIIITANTNQIVTGTGGAQVMLNFPAPAGNITLNFPNTADTIVGRATTDTLTNKTINNSTIQGNEVISTYVNEAVTGTFLNRLAQLSGLGTVSVPGISATSGVIGICVSGCSTTGSSQIAASGILTCTFDGATTANDYAQISSTLQGFCHDAGATFPTNGNQVLGRVLSTNGGTGNYSMQFFSPEIKASVITATAKADLVAQSANVGPNLLYAVPATGQGIYRASCYVVLTQAATTSSTLPSCTILWTDAEASFIEAQLWTITSTTNTVGTLGGTLGTAGNNTPSVGLINAKASTNIQYSTGATYASVGATPMQYAIHVRLEGPF